MDQTDTNLLTIFHISLTLMKQTARNGYRSPLHVRMFTQRVQIQISHLVLSADPL